jgi:conjugation system TraG family ATPase
VVHKQDWFIRENYTPEIQKDDLSFLSRSFERHFNERPYLNHTCYLFLTKTTKERSRRQSDFSTLCRGFIVPKEIQDKETALKFLESAGQFERIVGDSGFIKLTRLTSDEIIGTPTQAGNHRKSTIALSQCDTTSLQDISWQLQKWRIGDNLLCLHTAVRCRRSAFAGQNRRRYEKLSTGRSDCRLSYASPVGVLLSCNHIYNQYIFIDDHRKTFNGLKRWRVTCTHFPLLTRQSNQQGMDLKVPETKLTLRLDFGALPLQRDGVVG